MENGQHCHWENLVVSLHYSEQEKWNLLRQNTDYFRGYLRCKMRTTDTWIVTQKELITWPQEIKSNEKLPERISLVKCYKDKQNRHITLTKALMKIASLK